MMKYANYTVIRGLLVFSVILMVAVIAYGCGGSGGGSSRDNPVAYGTGTGTGTGTDGGVNGTGNGGSGIELVCVYNPSLGAQTSHKEHFASIVKESSGYVWTGTKNQICISKATIGDGTDGDVIICNLDSIYAEPGSYGYTMISGSERTMYLGGDALTLTFQHELGHAKMILDDHYGTDITCIMNASNGGQYMMQRNYCEGGQFDCWGTVVSGFGVSAAGGSGSCPQTEIVIQ
ncbi:MAG: hypothetical protein ACYS8W_16110 [Planctomycetota bacterium]|jgi:hypothetical protein